MVGVAVPVGVPVAVPVPAHYYLPPGGPVHRASAQEHILKSAYNIECPRISGHPDSFALEVRVAREFLRRCLRSGRKILRFRVHLQNGLLHGRDVSRQVSLHVEASSCCASATPLRA